MDKKSKWLRLRKQGVGSSDIGVIMNKSRFKTPYDLYLEKTQETIEVDNFNIRRGNALEPTIIDSYLRSSGDRLLEHKEAVEYFKLNTVLVSTDPVMYRSSLNPVMQGSPDGLILSEDHEGMGVLEAKAPSSQVYRKIKREGIPDDWVCQVQWIMRLLGLQWAVVVVFSAEYWELQSFIIEADNDYQESLVETAMHWWGCILTNTAPNITLDEPEIGLRGEVVKVNSAVWYEVGEEYLVAKEAAAQATAKLNKVKGRFRKIIGDSYCTEGNGFRVFRKPFRVFNYKI